MVRCGLVIGIMARITILRETGIDATDMTLRAIQRSMLSGEREERVIEKSRGPCADRMAFLTIMRIVACQMGRCRLEVRCMTRIAILREAHKDARNRMALCAIHSCVPPHKREEIMIYKGTLPSCRLMTFFAVGYPTIRQMVWVDGLRQIILMADFALGWCSPELPGCSSFMTALTTCNCVGSHQRKPGGSMFANQTDWLPVNLRMATFAIQP